MGNVLPQYQVSSAAAGGIVTRSGLLNVHEGEPIIPAGIARMDFDGMSKGDTFNFEVNEAGGEIDMTRLAATVAFAKKTAQ